MGAAACKAKILLDGGSASGYAQALCDTVRNLSDGQIAKLTDDVAYPIIKRLIAAETALGEAHNLLLDAVGYDGPRP